MIRRKKQRIHKPEGFCPTKWIDARENSCYFYAINYMIPLKENIDVGEIGGIRPELYYTDFELIRRLYADMKALHAEIRRSSLEEVAGIREWKIAMFNSQSHNFEEYDYHFMREERPGLWSHKFVNVLPDTRDNNDDIIVDPRYADLTGSEVKYEFVDFFMLKEKKFL